MVSAFQGNKAGTKTMLPVIESFMAAHRLPDVTVVADLTVVFAAWPSAAGSSTRPAGHPQIRQDRPPLPHHPDPGRPRTITAADPPARGTPPGPRPRPRPAGCALGCHMDW
jgi:hypothetical protein